jgi:hypothetical protein
MNLAKPAVALIRGHGNAVAGPDFQTAVKYAVFTEMNARLQTIVIGLGGPIKYISGPCRLPRNNP